MSFFPGSLIALRGRKYRVAVGATAAIERLELRQLLSSTLAITTTDGVISSAATPATVQLYASQTLFVDAITNSSLIDPIATKLTWNFGDTSAASQYNVLPGFNAAHIYNTPGTYTLVLSAIEGSAADPVYDTPATMTVVVSPDTRPTVYIAAYTHPNLDVTSTTPQDPTDLAHVMAYTNPVNKVTGFQSNTIYRFNSGDTFIAPYYGLDLSQGRQNITLGAYQTPPPPPGVEAANWPGVGTTPPVIDGSEATGSNMTISVWTNGATENFDKNVLVEGLEFNDQEAAAGDANTQANDVLDPQGRNVTLLNDTFSYVGSVVNTANYPSAGMLLENNTSVAPTSTTAGLQAYFFFFDDSDSVLLGNHVAGSEVQISIRGQTSSEGYGAPPGYRGFLLYDNTIAGGQNVAKSDLGLQNGTYAWVADNDFEFGSGAVGTSISIGSGHIQTSPVLYTVIDSNNFGNNVDLEMGGGDEAHVMVRNNVFQMSTNHAIFIGGYQTWENPFDTQHELVYRDIEDVRSLHNPIVSLLQNSVPSSPPMLSIGGSGGVLTWQQIDADDPTGQNNPYNGAAYTSTTNGDEVYIPGNGPGSPTQTLGIDMEDNLFVAPYSVGPYQGSTIQLYANDLNSFDVLKNNVWVDASRQTFTFGNGAAGDSIAQWNQIPLANGGTPSDTVLSAGSGLGDSAATAFTPIASSLLDIGQASVVGVLNDFYGNPLSSSAAVLVGAVQAPPEPPAGLNAMASDGDVNLNWPAVATGNALGSNILGYNVYRSTSGTGGWTLLNANPIDATSYTDATASAGTWYYEVISVDESANKSLPSPIASATTGSGATASATFVKADAATEGSWTGVYGSDGYDLFNDAASQPAYAQVTPSGQSAYTWATENGSADPRYLEDSPSASTRTAACYYAQSTFSLDVNTTDGNSHQIALYLLDYDDQQRSETVQLSDTGSGTVLNTQHVSNFVGGQWLVWDISGNVTITFANGPSPSLNAVASAILFDPVASEGGSPAAPTGLSVAGATDTSVSLSWTESTAATGYAIWRATGNGTYSQIGNSDTTSGNNIFTFTDASTTDNAPPQPGTTYSYEVFAVNSSGTSGASNIVTYTTPGTGPAAPTGLLVSGSFPNDIALDWNAPSGATGYQLWRQSPGGTFQQIASPTTPYFTDTTCSPETSYSYEVFAVNSSGTSGASNIVTYTTPGTGPAAPTGLLVSGSFPNDIALDWNAPSGATGYQLWRQSPGGTFQQIANPTTPWFTDTTCSPDTTYSYEVFAVDSSGTSGASNVVTYTTPSA